MRFERLAMATLGLAILVILWGAVVRATGSGAGCGAHWPLCNGVIVPPNPRIATLIEFGHRVSSGLLLLAAAALVFAAWRLYPPRHPARRSAFAVLVFVLLEAAIGAGIVLLQLVEANASALRAVYVAAHLANTMMLVAALTATVWSARERPALTKAPSVEWRRWLTAGLAALVVVSALGAIVALGDTLFPQSSLASGFAADFDPASHFLIRLRAWHPLAATATSLYLVALLSRGHALDDPATRIAARWTNGLIVLQMAIGAANVILLAPLVIQLAHLLVSNLLWVAVVWMRMAVKTGQVRSTKYEVRSTE
jgi:cytochrome c oxidase assembly protein subunit 15